MTEKGNNTNLLSSATQPFINNCLDVLKRKDIKLEIKKIISPLIDILLGDIYPYIYIIVVFFIFILFILITILVLLIILVRYRTIT